MQAIQLAISDEFVGQFATLTATSEIWITTIFSHMLHDSTPRYVGPSVGGPLFIFSAFLSPGAILQHCSYPPARD